MSLTAFDIVLLLAFAVVVVKVTMSGFISEFFSKAAVIIGAAVAVLFFRKASPYVAKVAGESALADAVAFLLLFLAVYLAVKLVQRLVGSATENETLDNLDHALGFFLGVVEGFILILLVLAVVGGVPWFDLSFLTKGSVLSRFLGPLVSGAPGVISGLMPAFLK